MAPRTALLVTAASLVLSASSSLSASDWYVDGSVSQSRDGTTWETAFKTVQEGIDATSDSDTVIVAEGTHVGYIHFKSKNITLTSTDPLDPTVVANTVIDGRGRTSVVMFAGTEDETCVLAGFTIQNGSADYGGGICGGTEQNHTHAMIRHNVITENQATAEWPHGLGGGIAFCDGLIEHNRIVRNVARRGGGLYQCNGTILNNVITGNLAEPDGGGLLLCEATIENNTIVRNFAQLGGGLSHCEGTILNCIIWGNGGGQLSSCSDPSYSCIALWTGGGEGNMSSYPHFVDAAHSDFHLRTWSPCIDAGDPASPFSQEPQPNGGRINMGAYGNTFEATVASPDSDEDGLPDQWELNFFESLLQTASGNPDGDSLSNVEEYHRGLDPTSALVTWYVDASATTSGDGTSWETAFHTIQEGLGAAADGDTVIVSMGTYVENVDFNGKNVVLQSDDPDDPVVVANTVIDGNHAGSAVVFNGSESESCVLAGFTIRNGRATQGGGIRGDGTLATIRNNLIIANLAEWYGGGLSGCDGLIENNTVSENYAFEGGGFADCSGSIRNNLIVENTASISGGGLYDCHGSIEHNTISGNSAFDGGGLAYCDGDIQNNVIAANSAEGNGGGLHSCNGAIENNTVYGNSAEGTGGGLSNCGGIIRNCIVWKNDAPDGAQLSLSGLPTYSCIKDWTGGGEGNVAYYPYFVDATNGDYHLMSWSPCIDAGDPTSPFSEEPEPNGGRINMGAYGNTPEATSPSPDSDGDGLPDDWEMEFFGDLTQGPDDDPDGDSVSNIEEYHRGSGPSSLPVWYVDGSAPVSGDGRSWKEAFKTIQEGIDGASDGDTVLVARGTYLETIHFGGKNIKLTSVDPLDPDVVANTIVDALKKSQSVVTLDGTENETCVLSGFTIRNGKSEFGGGICGGTEDTRTRATIENNVIVGNEASDSGGGLAYCDGKIQNNTITGNSASAYGGGLHNCDGTIRANMISANSAPVGGGGVAYCDGTIQNNTVSENSAGQGWGNDGGGLYACHGVIENNTIRGNTADEGGGLSGCEGTIQANTISGNSAQWGGGLHGCGGTIQNNIITGNSASSDGGGLAFCDGMIQNNTIVGNSASWEAGGLAYCDGRIRNCIIWGNMAPDCAQCAGNPTYSCVQDWAGAGEGNIAADPKFVDPEGSDDDPQTWEDNDYRLADGSPCIDAGANGYWFIWPQRDLDGSCRLVGERVDMGCYEYGSSPDSDGDLLSDEEEMAAKTNPELEDTDGDGLRDGLERLRGSDPLAATLPRTIHVPSEFSTIQEALCLAVNGDEVIVAPGTYRGNIVFSGVDVVLRSSDPEEPDVVASTVLDGGGAGPVVRLTGNESEACVLSGFTIQNGISGYGGGICGGTPQKHTRATIQNNIITGNGAGIGAGIAFCDGIIQNNIVSDNRAWPGGGGGFYCCDGTIRNNTVTGNAAEHGGGFLDCHGIVQGNTISGNVAHGGQMFWRIGGGLAGCDGTIENNAITGNSADWGAGLFDCNGTIRNNVIADNHGAGLAACNGLIHNNAICHNEAAGVGGGGWSGEIPCTATIQNNTITGNSVGLRSCTGTILNCIIWGNVEEQLRVCGEPSYSCIQGWTGGGEGNICLDPRFVDPDNGDFHVSAWSHCIDAGDPTSDFSNEPEPNGGRVNMGAYGNTPEATSKCADTDADGLPDDWEMHWFGDLDEDGNSDPDGDGMTSFEEYQHDTNPIWSGPWYVHGSVAVSRDGMSWDTAFKTIQEGINASYHGETVLVAQGTYIENIHFDAKDITLSSTDPLDPEVVEKTIIDGSQTGSVVTFDGSEDQTCVLSGFTITNGNGGIRGRETDATIRNNVITANSGAGMIDCNGTVQNNTIAENSGDGMSNCGGTIEANTITDNHGHGLHDCGGTIQDNVISGNRAGQGGGLYSCNGTVQNNAIAGNSATSSGGGLFDCDGMIENNRIYGNSARDGGGLYSCNGTVQNNVIAGNSATYDGGGLYGCNGKVEDNVIAENSATSSGGGLFDCDGMIENNMIYGNSARDGGGLFDCDSTIQNNTITENSAELFGGGLSYCDGAIQNNIIHGNSAYWGGGLYSCNGTIQNNVIAGNSATYGGGLYNCDGPILSNTIYANSAFERGGGLHDCDGTILNCIIWGNTAWEGPQLYGWSVPTYSCIENWTGGGEGSISEDPRFVDANNGNFRLLPDSPCTDAGNLSAALRPWLSLSGQGARLSWSPGEDLDGNPRISGEGVDMGAYEYQSTPANFRVEYSSDLETWQQAITTTGLEWLDNQIQETKTRFYRVSVSP